MQKVDYIIVGFGIAGLCFCEQLLRNNKTFVVFDSGLGSATAVSGGIFNPVVLKRFSLAWNAKDFLAYALPFYESLSKNFGLSLIENKPVLRIFNGPEEQNDWTVASDKPDLSVFLSSKFVQNNNPHINAPYGFGEVFGGGIVGVNSLLGSFRRKLAATGNFYDEKFDYELISDTGENVVYKNFEAKKILFAEGIAAMKNPFAPKGFLIGNKGEFLIIKAEKLKLESILKGGVFIIPLGSDLYKVGATYEAGNYSHKTTAENLRHIKTKLKKMINCPFEIISQIAGVRPTTLDRKPVLGNSPTYENFVFFNGLGTHGLMMAPLLSKQLFDFLANGKALPPEIDIKRKFN